MGVPFLVSRWPCGPSSRIGWPLPCRMRRPAMICGPNRKTKNSAVTTAPAVLKGDVAEDVERGQALAQLAEEIQHAARVSVPTRRREPRTGENASRRPAQPLLDLVDEQGEAHAFRPFDHNSVAIGKAGEDRLDEPVDIAANARRPGLAERPRPSASIAAPTRKMLCGTSAEHRILQRLVELGALRPELQHVAEHQHLAAAGAAGSRRRRPSPRPSRRRWRCSSRRPATAACRRARAGVVSPRPSAAPKSASALSDDITVDAG